MDKQLKILATLLLSLAAHAQVLQGVVGSSGVSGLIPITVEATCSGSGNTQTVACSAPMTVTAGSTIECNGSAFGSDPMTLYFNDATNGANGAVYDNIRGISHSGSANAWGAMAVWANSAGGSITPQINNWEGTFEQHIKCRSLKGTRTTLVLDGGSVNQTQNTTAANPTSGTAAAPTNNNEIVIGAMFRSATATVSDSSPWTPGGTITAIGTTGNYPLYDHYSIQTTATTANSPMTASSGNYSDSQAAILNGSNPAGYRGLTGFYGVPAIAKTNGASATAADLSGATTTLVSLNKNTSPIWTLTGTAPTYSTAVAPTGTGTIIVQGVPHSFGDAATSVDFGSLTASFFTSGIKGYVMGQSVWISSFIRVASSGIVSTNFCDVIRVYGGANDFMVNLQAEYNTTDGLYFSLEPSGTSTFGYKSTTGFSLDTDYWVQMALPSVNDQYYKFLIYSKSGGAWSQAGSQNLDELCGTSGNCNSGGFTATASTTGTASSGSTALTVASGTGIVAGQEVRGTGIPYMTIVASVAGTAVTLSQKTTGALSGTAVTFFNKNQYLNTATNGSASAGSTALTIVVPSVGAVAVSQPVGGTGIVPGTYVTAVSGTSVTLSQPTSAALSSTGVTFWNFPSSQMGNDFGKFSSCNMSNKILFSGMTYDPFNSWGAFAPN